MSKVFHLVYISKAHDDLSYTDVHTILNTSRTYNAFHEISGLLVLRDGYFMQLLEGPEDRIKFLLGKIMMDKRNHDLKVLLETQSDKRLFQDWSMAFVDGDLSHNATPYLVNLYEVLLAQNNSKKDLIMLALRAFQASAPTLK